MLAYPQFSVFILPVSKLLRKQRSKPPGHTAAEGGTLLLRVGSDRFLCFVFASFSLSSKRRSISLTVASHFSGSFSWQVRSVNCSHISRFGPT